MENQTDNDSDSEPREHRWWRAVREGCVKDVSQLSIYFTGDLNHLHKTLNCALEYGHLNVVTWLIEHTALHHEFRCLEQSLVYAGLNTHWNIVKWLVNNTQVNVNYADVKNKNSILHYVTLSNTNRPLIQGSDMLLRIDMTELCKRVYVRGEDVNVPDNYN